MTTDIVVVPSPHAEAAKSIVEKIRALREEIPRFLHEVSEETRALVQKSSVPDVMIESASASIQTFPRLEQAIGTDAPTMRDAFSFALAYDPVVREASAFARSVAHTIRVQRAKAGANALDVLAIADRLSKQKDGAELRPYVEDMRRKLAKRKRTRKAISEPAPAPDATSTAAPSKKV
jgi:hypothetical protein